MNETQYNFLPVLMVDDEESWLYSLSMTLEYSAGINNIIQCSDSRKVMDILAGQEFGLVLLDLTMPHISGEKLLQQIVVEYPEIPVVILSGMNQLDTAVKCMKMGAFDYFIKTTEKERLIAGIRRALEHKQMQQQYKKLKASLLQGGLENPDAFSEIVTVSRKMRSVFQYIEAIAKSCEPVLITGESGVGKELVARAIQKISRPDDPLVAVNVAGLDDNVFSDTLFGHARGAFTGADRNRPGMIEKAGTGMLFLDEIGDLSSASQVKLLRLLQEGEYFSLGSDSPKRARARVVVATNQDLEAKQASGEFRKDLYYRLHAHHINIPPLRERPEDISLLLDYFLDEAAKSLGKKKPTPPEQLPVLLSTYHFPGNVREFRAMVFDAVSVHKGGKLSMDTFKKVIGQNEKDLRDIPHSNITQNNGTLIFTERLPTLAESAEILVSEAMRRSKNNQTIAAGLLGISRQALNKRLNKSSH